MKSTTQPGLNRTGLATSPLQGKSMVELAELTDPPPGGANDTLAARAIYGREAVEPMGTVPPPATLKEAGEQLKGAVKGQKLTVLVDKLGERAAFERTGTRLYDGMLVKFDTFGSWPGGPTRKDLEKIRSDEHRHFVLVAEVIAKLGSDPTAVTPSANLHALASEGVLKAITDPRTTLRECVEAIAVAELVDNDCWTNLTELVRAAGHEDIASRFEEAVADERVHLEQVRTWIAASLGTAVSIVPGARRATLVDRMKTAPRPPARRTGSKAVVRASAKRPAPVKRGVTRGPPKKVTRRAKVSAKISRKPTTPKRGGKSTRSR